MGASKKGQAGTTQATDPGNAVSGGLPSADASVGQIREIIFGEQMRAYEARFDELEKKLQERAETVLSNLVERISDLEVSLRSDLKGLKGDLEKTAASNTEALQETTSKMQTALEEAVRKLQEEKTDRATLATMFAEVASRLKDAEA
jgi:hypothetical protein